MDGNIMPSYSEYKYFSPILGVDSARLSMQDKHGREHFAIIPLDGTGKLNRLLRRKALDTIYDHIENGSEPGEVIIGGQHDDVNL